MKNKIIGVAFAGALLSPFVAFAQDLQLTDANSIATIIGQITNWASIIFVSIGVLFFIWGAFLWMTAGADDDKKSTGKSHMINGLIGIFLIVSVWGLINLMLSTIGTANDANKSSALINVNKAVNTPAL